MCEITFVLLVLTDCYPFTHIWTWIQCLSLHSTRKVIKESPNDETRERARISAVETQGFTRMVQRKSLIWERDSLARTTYNPEHISDCNVKATVGKHFLFNEPIPRSENGQGYLRVSRSSLWWQQREYFLMYGHQRASRHAWKKGTSGL